YGFPESHAASFALIAYATSWLRCHYPDVFTCSLLDAQPMGFYTPATIVDDAIRHGVEVRPVDVTASDWDCTLEPASVRDREEARTEPGGARRPRSKARRGSGQAVRDRGATPLRGMHRPSRFAVRMGLRYVKSLSEERDWRRIEAARAKRPFASLADFSRRTRLDDRVLRRLAEAGAFAPFEGRRRAALWQAQGLGPASEAPLPVAPDEPLPDFDPLDDFQAIDWDYRFSAHSTRGHPLAPLREALAAQNLPDARTVAGMPDGGRVRYAGLVICRQRPGTASGVTFMTLEDETGFVNIVIWKQVFDDHAVLARTASFLGVSGKLQSESGVVHVVADALWAPEIPARPPTAGSRDFH
ncbi:MAG: error-prone DNA polymerase, partial [Chloroflexi bacterium]|nr:error-prone DNA polymerase [Chloroflexota bacterium]